MQFVDVKNDIAFRKIFGNRKKTQINAPKLKVIPDNVDDEGLREAYLDADRHKWKKEELIVYDNASIATQDEKGRLAAAEKKGERKGEEKKEIDAVLGLDKIGLPKEKIAEARLFRKVCQGIER